MEQLQSFFSSTIGSSIASFSWALLWLIGGYIVARLVAAAVRRLLARTDLDNRFVKRFSSDLDIPSFSLEDVIARALFWLLMLFVFVGFFQRLSLPGVADPINNLLSQVTTQYLPRLGGGLLLLVVAWLVATFLKLAVSKGSEMLRIDDRLSQHAALEEGERVTVSRPLATAVFWFTFLLFLPAVLARLGIGEIAAPVQSMFAQVFAYVPNVLAATITFLVGWFIARIVRQVVSNLAAAVGADRLGRRIGLAAEQSLSTLLGTIVYTLIFLFTIISALNTLQIETISEPATRMLTTIINAIPGIVGAVVVLAVSFYVARVVASLLGDLLAGLGFDGMPARLGIPYRGTRKPSQLVGYLVQVAVMLFAAISAAEILGSAFLADILATLIGFLGQVVLAAVILAIGLYLANLASSVILSAGGAQANFGATMARLAILILSGAMALRQLGVADDIVNMAFGIMLGALGIAAALAFGLGSREIAGREVERALGMLRGSGHESQRPARQKDPDVDPGD